MKYSISWGCEVGPSCSSKGGASWGALTAAAVLLQTAYCSDCFSSSNSGEPPFPKKLNPSLSSNRMTEFGALLELQKWAALR